MAGEHRQLICDCVYEEALAGASGAADEHLEWFRHARRRRLFFERAHDEVKDLALAGVHAPDLVAVLIGVNDALADLDRLFGILFDGGQIQGFTPTSSRLHALTILLQLDAGRFS